jgi:hypothetical protein
LVAQHGDLDVLGVLALETPKRHAEKPTRHEVKKGQGHPPIIPCPVLAAQRTRPSF